MPPACVVERSATVPSGHSNYSIKQRENERYVFVCVFFKNSSNCRAGEGLVSHTVTDDEDVQKAGELKGGTWMPSLLFTSEYQGQA